MSFEFDLFSINNISVPRVSIINQNRSTTKVKKTFPIRNSVQNELFPLDNIIVDKEKLRITKKFYKYEQRKQYETTDRYHITIISNWFKRLYSAMNRSISTKNRRNDKNYLIDLDRYNEYIKYGLPANPPIKPQFFPPPDFDRNFLIKLWDIQEGRDAYTNQPMILDSTLEAFNPSGDRISSDIPYKKGNMVLCCYSTNMGKNNFDIYDERENSWINYITNKDPIKKQEIYDRIDRIQKLSLLV